MTHTKWLLSAIYLLLIVPALYAGIECRWFKSEAPFPGRFGRYGEAVNLTDSGNIIISSIAKDTLASGESVPMYALYFSAYNHFGQSLWSTHAGSFDNETPIHTLIDNSQHITLPGTNSFTRYNLQGDKTENLPLHVSDSFDYSITAVTQHDDTLITAGAVCNSKTQISAPKLLCAIYKHPTDTASMLFLSIYGSQNSNCHIRQITTSDHYVSITGSFGNIGDTLYIADQKLIAVSPSDRFVITMCSTGSINSLYHFNDDVFISNISHSSDGTLYIAGGYSQTLDIGRFHYKSSGGEDAFLCKVNPGAIQQWIKVWGSPFTDDHCSAFTFDSDSLIWLTGTSASTINGFTRTSASKLFIASIYPKYGFVKDDILITGDNKADGRGIVVKENVLFISGYYNGSIDISDNHFETPGTSFSMFVASFTTNNCIPGIVSVNTQTINNKKIQFSNKRLVTLNGRSVTPEINRTSPLLLKNNRFILGKQIMLRTGGGL